MAERKRYAGNTDRGAELLGKARVLLTQLRQQMAVLNLKLGQRALDFDDGTRIEVSIVFGQDDIKIYAPPDIAQETEEEALIRIGADPDFLVRNAVNADIVTTSDLLTLTITVYDTIDITPSAPGEGTNDIVLVTSNVKLTIITTTYPPVYVPPPKPPQIFIGGQRDDGRAFIWDDVNGFTLLGLRDTFGYLEKRGIVYGFSADGKLPFGSVTVPRQYQFINPFDGSSKTVTEDMDIAAVWRNGAGDSDTPKFFGGPTVVQNGDSSAAYKMDANGTVHGSLSRWPSSTSKSRVSTGFNWDGIGGHTMTATGTPLAAPTGTITSSNGRLKVQAGKYQLDNGPWITYGTTVVGYAALHIPYTPPPPPDQTPTVSTSVLVFSG